MNFSRTLFTEKTTFLGYIIWSTTLPCCLLGVRRGVNVAAFPFLWLCDFSLSSFNSLSLFLQFLCHLAWLSTSVGAIPLPSSKNAIFNGIGEDPILSNSWIAEAAFSYVLSASISERFVPKGHCRAPSYYRDRYTYPNPQIHWLWRLWLVYRHFCQTFLWHDAIAYHTLAKTIHLLKLILLQLLYSTFRTQLCTLGQHHNMIVSMCRVCWEIM